MYEILTLDNGVRIVYEKLPYVRSAALGIWVAAGSRFESDEDAGASHFIEHMVFKGTQSRSAAELAEETDAIGGQVNAYTSKDCTCFYGKVLDTHLPRLADILSDMFLHSKFDEQDASGERGVIFEEIDMYEDDPADLVNERIYPAVYGSNPLARPVLGYKETLKGMTGEFLRGFMRRHYVGESVVLSLCGSIRDEDVKDLAERFSAVGKGERAKFSPAEFSPTFTVREKPIEQNHLLLAFPGTSFSDGDRFAFQLLSDILGGGSSSRLFQSVREERGLCYSVYSSGASFAETGILGVYTACGKDTERQALEVIRAEIEKLVQDGVSQKELDRVREQIKANLVMGLESTSSRCARNGKSILRLGRVTDPDEVIAKYDAVTREDILRLAREKLAPDCLGFSAVGKVMAEEDYRAVLVG